MSRMAMTAKVKDELSRLEVTKPCCRKAEVSTMLRFAGPCAACTQELRSKFHVEARIIEGDEYVPKMNVTPNSVAAKDD